MNSKTKNCQNCKKDFNIEPDDFSFYEKMKVPSPTFCPMCRAERRLTFRNERKLFKVKNSFSGKDMFSLYPQKNNKKNLTQEEWFNDNFDAMEYGQDYNFSKPFFEQFFELENRVPIFPLRVEYMVDSPYCANATALKDSYLCFNSSYSENCMYGNATDYSKDCIDNSHIKNSERCYECFWIQNCYQCYFTIMSVESTNLWFCRDCLGCNDCFGSVNLRNKNYYFFNEKYSKEEYDKKMKEYNLNTREVIEYAHKGECNQGCTKAFRIILDELQFYRKVGIPVPNVCPACRTMDRLKLRLGIELYNQLCMCDGIQSENGGYQNFSTQ